MAPLALCNYVSYDLLKKEGLPTEGEGDESSGKKPCVVALDIGVETSNLVITDGERIIWQRPIPIGGNRFTRALTKELKLTFAKAEHLKKNATKTAQADLKRILLALKPDLNEFVNEVQKSLNFFANTHRDAQIQYVVGLGSAFKLPGLQKYLNEKLQLEVRKLQKFQRLAGESVISAPVFTDNMLTFAVAYGLAVQGLKLSRLQTNLLPQEIRTERLIRAKKPWAVAAAALLLLGVAGLTFGYKLEHDAVAAPVIEEAQKSAGDVALARVKAASDKCDAKARDVIKEDRAVKSIIAGQEERFNWIKLNRYINESLPRPDGVGLTSLQKAKYWDKGEPMSGKDSFDLYTKAQSGGDGDVNESLGGLVQVNIEAVDALYTDDLGTYYKRMIDTNKAMLGLSDADQKTPPKGKGWIVELRGFTYNRGQQQFLLDGLVDNLARNAVAKPAEPAPKGKEATAKKEVKEIEPIAGRISHITLYKFVRDPEPSGTRFQLIDHSVLPYLVAGMTGKEKDPGPAPPPQPGQRPGAQAANVRNRDGWKPLGIAAAGFGKGGERIANLLNEKKDKEKEKTDKKQHQRTEFIVLLVWQEPLSDVESGSETGGNRPSGGNNAGGRSR
jgi:hypothetical protein